MCQKLSQLRVSLLDEMVLRDLFQVLGMNATLRCCLSIMGQAHPRARREVKKEPVFFGEQALTRASRLGLFIYFLNTCYLCLQRINDRMCEDQSATEVLTCRSRSNAVVLLHAVPSDESDIIARTLADQLPAKALAQIRPLKCCERRMQLCQICSCWRSTLPTWP